MADNCAVPTLAQQQYGLIQSRIEDDLLRTVHAALEAAAEAARSDISSANLNLPPPSIEYFAASTHQKLYCFLCKADPKTFEGGNANIAIGIIRNAQQLAKFYWGADIEPLP